MRQWDRESIKDNTMTLSEFFQRFQLFMEASARPVIKLVGISQFLLHISHCRFFRFFFLWSCVFFNVGKLWKKNYNKI